MKCEYCGNKFREDRRGACQSCGGPEPEEYKFQELEIYAMKLRIEAEIQSQMMAMQQQMMISQTMGFPPPDDFGKMWRVK